MDLKKILKNVKLHESTISMVLGAFLIIISGIIIINFFAKNDGRIIPTTEIIESEISLPAVHDVSEGENLWTISEKYYGTGYNWLDIANENSIENPGDIEVGDQLTIPDVEHRETSANIPTKPITQVPTPTSKVIPQIIEDRENMMDENEIYVVQDGDNLWKIAENKYKSGYNWVDIASANDLQNPGLVTTGQELIIPETEAKIITISEPIQAPDTNPIYDNNYIVQKGDNLWNISVRAYGDGYKWVEIARENNLENPNLIFSGNTLIIPR